MKILRKSLWTLSLATAAFLVAGCGNQSSGGKLASINGETITMQQFYEYLEAKPEVQVQLSNGQVVSAIVMDTLGFQALQDLIRQRIIVQLAKDNKVAPTAQEIDAEVEFQRKRKAEFVTSLKEKGLSLEQIRESLEVDLSREKLLTSDISITDAEVSKFINENKDSFTIPASVDAKWVFVTNEAKRREVDRELNAGQSFATVARRMSDDPNAKETLGQFPRRFINELPKEMQSVVQETPAGKETRWIQLSDGWAKLYIEKKAGAQENLPNEVERQWIKRQLAVRKGLTSKDLDRRLLDKLRNSKIMVDYRELRARWDEAFKQIEKAALETKTNTNAGADAGEKKDE